MTVNRAPDGAPPWSPTSIAATAATVAILAAGCATTFREVPRSGANDVPSYLGAASRAGAADVELEPDPQLAWSSTDIRGTVGVPAVGERVTVVSSIDRWLYALDSRTGQLYWRHRSRGPFAAGPVIADGLVLVPTQGAEGRLTAVDLFTGKRRWEVEVGDVASPLTVREGVVYGATQTGGVFAHSLSDGTQRWRTGGAPTASGPLLVGPHVVVATLRDTLVVLDAATGRSSARVSIPFTATSPLAAIDDSTVALTSPAGAILSLAVPSGRVRWQVRTPAPIFGSPVVARDTVFALGNDGELWAVPSGDTAGLVRVPIGGTTVAAPVILRRGVLVATVDGSIVHFDRTTGRRSWVRQVEGELRHPPIVTQGQIVVAPLIGDVVSFR